MALTLARCNSSLILLQAGFVGVRAVLWGIARKKPKQTMFKVRIETVVAGMTQGNEVIVHRYAANGPGADVMHMKLKVYMIVWTTTTNTAPVRVSLQDPHPMLRRGSAIHRGAAE